MQCSAVQCSDCPSYRQCRLLMAAIGSGGQAGRGAQQCSAEQCSAVQCSAVQQVLLPVRNYSQRGPPGSSLSRPKCRETQTASPGPPPPGALGFPARRSGPVPGPVPGPVWPPRLMAGPPLIAPLHSTAPPHPLLHTPALHTPSPSRSGGRGRRKKRREGTSEMKRAGDSSLLAGTIYLQDQANFGGACLLGCRRLSFPRPVQPPVPGPGRLARWGETGYSPDWTHCAGAMV
jgi:hypothetical protein